MKKFQIFGVLSMSAILGAAMLGGCSEPPKEQEEEKEPPKIEYTVDESLPGTVDANAQQFYASNVERVQSPLSGKKIYWLGSSVTYGASSYGESMADFLAAKTGCVSVKDAVSGTTIFDDGSTGNTGASSYTRRLKNSTYFNTDEEIDAFICQISTNDAWGDRKKNWGEIAPADKLQQEDFDLKTTLGGIEFIIAYVTDTWGCPIYFYSGAYFGDKNVDPAPRANENPKGSDYGELVDKVQEIAAKWRKELVDVQVIDLYHDVDFNAAVSDEYYSWATSDPVHPKRVGYLQWWMPYFEQFLLVNLKLV